MKILQVGKFYFPAKGGVETVLQHLSEGLVRSGDEVTVLCSALSRSSSTEKINGVTVIRKAYFGKLFSQPICPTLPCTLLDLAKQFDIVHLHSPNPVAEFSTLVLLKKIPVVLSYHSDIVRQKILKCLYRPFLTAFLRKTDVIVVAAENIIMCSNTLGPFQNKCSVIPFGLNPSQLSLASKASIDLIRSKYGKYVLFVGRFVPYKGINYLIDAMAGLDAQLILIGNGPLRASLEAQVQRLKLQDKIHFLGEIKEDEARNAYYAACEVFALPSINHSEAFGMVLLEAMSFGKPLVTTNLVSGVSHLNNDGITGLQVPPCDSVALRKALESLLKDPQRCKAMGEIAYKRFYEHFTVDKMVSSYRKLYEKLIF